MPRHPVHRRTCGGDTGRPTSPHGSSPRSPQRSRQPLQQTEPPPAMNRPFVLMIHSALTAVLSVCAGAWAQSPATSPPSNGPLPPLPYGAGFEQRHTSGQASPGRITSDTKSSTDNATAARIPLQTTPPTIPTTPESSPVSAAGNGRGNGNSGRNGASGGGHGGRGR